MFRMLITSQARYTAGVTVYLLHAVNSHWRWGDEAGSDREHWPSKTQLNEHNTIVINRIFARLLHFSWTQKCVDLVNTSLWFLR